MRWHGRRPSAATAVVLHRCQPLGDLYSCGLDLFGTDLNTYLVQIFTELHLSQNVTVWDIVKRIQTALRVPDMVGGSDMALPALF